MTCACENTRVEFSREERRRARKKHTCGECGGQIVTGERHVYWVGSTREYGYSFSEFSTVRLCLRCAKDWDAIISIRNENPDAQICLCYGQLREAIGEAIVDGYLKKKSALAKRWFPPEPKAPNEGAQLSLGIS